MTVEGLRELEKALADLPKSTARSAIRRALRSAAEPLVNAAQENAPKLTGELEKSIIVGTRLTKRQARAARKEGKYFSEIHVGTSNPAGVPQEFGTFKEGAQPFMRPAWDGTKDQVLDGIKDSLAEEIEKARARLARKAARLAAKG